MVAEADLVLLLACRMVDDLHTLTTYSSQQPRPFLFVAAELGSLVARFYTQVYERCDNTVLVSQL